MTESIRKATSEIFISIFFVLLSLVLIAGCTTTDKNKEPAVKKPDKKKEAPAMTSDSTTPSALTTPTSDLSSQTAPTTPAHSLVAVIETNKGKIVFELYPSKAPKTVENFIKLSQEGFYNGIKWHRVEPGFVIQGGDPLSKDNDPSNDGYGGPGYTIPAEFNDLPHLEGTVAMARGEDPNSAGSQFYICLAPAPFLDGNYTVFGKVIEGMDVVKKIQVGDVMTKVTIQKR